MTTGIGPLSITSAQIEEGLRHVQNLEQQLSASDDAGIAELSDHVVGLASLSVNHLSPEEFELLERDIEDITGEIDDEPTVGDLEEASIEEEVVQPTANNPVHRKHHKKKHSKGFFKKTAHKVSRAVREVGRTAREMGKGVVKIGGPLGGYHPHTKSGQRPSGLAGKISHISDKAAHKVSHVARKVGRFVKEHKKEIIIGAIIAAVVVAGTVLILSSPAAAAGAGAAGAAGVVGAEEALNKPKDKTPPTTATTSPSLAKSVEKEVNSAPSGERSKDYRSQLRDQAFLKAQQEAKEVRFQGEAYSEQEIGQAKERANATFEQFKTDLVNSVEKKDVKEAFLVAASAISAASGGAGALLKAAGSYVGAVDIVERYGQKIETFYAPVSVAYQELHKMEEANRQGSIERCKREGYEPKLQFHPENDMQVDPEIVIYTDKNNPNPSNKITAFIPDLVPE